MPVPAKIQKILEGAEKKKKQGDLEFTRSKFKEAIETYSSAISLLAPLRSTPFGELCALKCFANQIQCYIRLGENEKAVAVSQFAITIPIVASETHLLQKICARSANAYENLEKYEFALGMIDKAISIDATSTDYDATRERLISKLTAGETIVPIPPRPEEFPAHDVTKVIGEILKSRGDVEPLAPLLNELCVRRVHLDRRDDRNYNLMWALSQAAVMRSNQPDENPDDIFPLLQLLLMNNVAAEQRFVSSDPSKKDKSSGQTPLMLFALAGAVDCVKLLIKFGASVFTCDDEGWIPLMIACTPSHPRVTAESLAAGRPPSNEEMVELLIESKSPVNAQNFMGLTPLICAAQAGDLPSAALLIHGGALINLRSANGFSPVIWALTSKHSNHEMIQLLLDACLTTPSVVTENDAKVTEKNTEEGEAEAEAAAAAEATAVRNIPTEDQRIELQKELVEDMKCYKIGHLSLNLKMAIKDFVTKYENTQKAVHKERGGGGGGGDGGGGTTRPPAYLLHRKLVETLGYLTHVVADAGGPTEITSRYLTTISSLNLYTSLVTQLQQQILPNSLFYQYQPINNVQEAVTNAPLIEQAHLSIMMKAAYGNIAGIESKEPLLSKASHHNYLLCTRHVDYMMLIREPCVSLMSPVIPSSEALDLIGKETQIVFVISIGGDYWVKNLQEKNYGKIHLSNITTSGANTATGGNTATATAVEMKLVRSASATHIPPYFIDNHSTSSSNRIETVTTLSHFSSPASSSASASSSSSASSHASPASASSSASSASCPTLVMIWPMCNMISSTSRDLIEKDEELLRSYNGPKILLLGDVRYNPLSRQVGEELREELERRYQCLEDQTIFLNNWKDFNNTLTVWIQRTV